MVVGCIKRNLIVSHQNFVKLVENLGANLELEWSPIVIYLKISISNVFDISNVMSFVDAMDVSFKVGSHSMILNLGSVVIRHCIAHPEVIRNFNWSLRWNHASKELENTGAELSFAFRL